MFYNLEKLLKSLNFSQKDISDYLGIHRQSFEQMIGGTRNMPEEVITALNSLEKLVDKRASAKVTMPEVRTISEAENRVCLEWLRIRKSELKLQLNNYRKKLVVMLEQYIESLQSLNNLLYILQHGQSLSRPQRRWLEERCNMERARLAESGTDQQLKMKIKIELAEIELTKVEKILSHEAFWFKEMIA
jgi:transcriptional regulator with XRE-family HTH domain